MRRAFALLLIAVVVGACGGSAVSTGSPAPSSGPSPGCESAPVAAAGPIVAFPIACLPPATEAQLRIEVIGALGPRLWCDPDEYPVAHGTEQERAIERFAEMQAEHDVYVAAAQHLGIDTTGEVDDAAKLAIYRVWKNAIAIPMDPVGNGSFRFDYTAQAANGGETGTRTTGIINPDRTITDRQSEPAGMPPCPICLSVGTPIETPDGPVAVDRLRLGDPVWTLDAAGRRVAGTVIALGSTPAPLGHHVVRLVLADGRSVLASPRHPLADGRPLGDLRPGDLVDGSRVAAADLIPYGGDDTYDLVVSGPTGIYLAGGVPLGTTLR
jgi:hypothetical protein